MKKIDHLRVEPVQRISNTNADFRRRMKENPNDKNKKKDKKNEKEGESFAEILKRKCEEKDR